MSIIWVVVANKSDVKIFEASAPKKEMRRVIEVEHPVAKLKISNLVSSPAGRAVNTAAHMKHTMAPDEDPLVHAARVFAKEISETLVREHSRGRYEELVLVAEPAFMGKLMLALLRKFCQQHLVATVPKEFTYMTDAEVVARLRGTLGELWKDPRLWEARGSVA